MKQFKCFVILLSLSAVLSVPQGILDEQDASLDLQSPQQDEGGAKGRKPVVEEPQIAERAFTVGKGLSQSFNQGLNQGVSLAQDFGKGIGNAFGNLFGGFGGDSPGPGKGLKASGKPTPKLAPLYFKGGCTERPITPANANVKCSPNSGQCDVKCLEDFSFPDKSTQLQIRCEAPGVWKVPNWDRMPDCEPICMPPCQNLGFCLAPNVCNCPDGFEGPQCQYAKSKPCLDKPPTPMNSRVVCNEKECMSSCNRGFAFPDGSKKLTMVCDSGNWVQRQQPPGKFQKVPDCQPVCDPPCANGGRCLPNNLCECPQQFRGPQCNYPMENCLPERMNFNGGYNCSGGSATFSCSLNCGASGVFEFPPAPIYSCDYAKAKYVPETIPQCIFESDQVQYFKSNSSSQSQMLIEQTSELEWNKGQQSNRETDWSFVSGGHQGFWGRKEYEKHFERFFSGGTDGDYSITIPEYSLIRDTSARPGTCLTWGGAHYKTFDGKVYSVQSDCSYVLVRDAAASTFSIVYGVQKCDPGSVCKRFVNVLVEDFVYEIDTKANGEPYIRKGDQSLTFPNQLDGLLFERVANFVIVQAEGLGFKLKWDTKATVTVDVSDVLWNRTVGLCGRINGMWVDDFEGRDGTPSSSLLGFVNSWEASSLTEQCRTNPNEKHACKWDTTEDQHVSSEATKMCEHLLKDEKFEKCRDVVDPRSYYEACRWDYCQCTEANREDCACSALETYFHECLRHKVELPDGWRGPLLCPVNCDNGRVYKMCGPINDETCSGPVAEPVRATDLCVEGCYCPTDSALHKEQCIPRAECPCTLRQKTYQPGEQVPNDCNTCTCVAGQWQCTDVQCGSRCAVLGDPHYTTFDGHHYDFMGKCSYYLMKGDNYSIEAENVPCSGAISQAMNFPVKSLSTVPSCTKSVTIRTDGGDIIKLKQNREVTVNGEEVVLQPSVWIDGVIIRHASSVFLAVELPNGLEIWWDGQSRVYIDAPPTFFGTTKGLCGTFNENQRDDMTTPEGDVEQSVAAFANGWKTNEVCQDASVELEPTHPCEVNGHNKAQAESRCAKIKDAIFEPCHQLVDPEQFYRDCLYDMCACQVKLGDCLCPAIGSYAKECAQKGVLVDWIPDVRECGVHCHGGQSYQVCGNSCQRTCYDIALYPKCRRKCVEGCNCPEGQTLDPFGQCVAIHECPCLHKGVEYPPGHQELRPGARSPDLCTCTSARWHCRPATIQERDLLANVTPATQMHCRSSHNEEYTPCEPEHQLTCKTMDQVSIKKPVECRPGCQCKKGYVFDPTSKTCIKPSECPCHHAGRSYAENNRITQDCNTCTCRSGKWECTKNQCPGMCVNWGESHYKTFDGKNYDFHGQCDYLFAKGAGSGAHEKFQIIVQSVPCGSSGVACSKSVTLRIGPADAEESITLTRHKKIPIGKFTERILVREAGLFIFIEVADLGLVLQWDHGTRIYLRLDPKWKGRVRGLCGNFNDNALDDFQSPSGGITEVDAKTFGDSWRLQKYCPETTDYIDTCTLHPHRKVWSVMKCSLLKSALFEKCHAEVPVEYFVEKCVLDSCGCDMGGDCECLCTSFAAYAHECNIRGIPIRWRSQELCPLQCNEECSSYSPCMTTCPPTTCENPSGSSNLCSGDSCVEGCQPRACPRGQIHRSDKELSCMPIAECASALCMVVDGVMYAEGDVMERDACHACYCSKGKRVCQGQPCYVATTTSMPVTRPTIPSTTSAREMSASTCRTGWSDWINSQHPKDGGDANDFEPIPDRLHPGVTNAPVCSVEQMVDIECRAASSKISHKKTGDNVDCSLESGLQCFPGGIKGRSVCHDYEIRILCDCSSSEAQKPVFVDPTIKPRRCDPARPNSPHPTNCYAFYQCVDRQNGVEQVEKTCNPPTMYNPNTMVCDWPEAVMKLRPECGSPDTTRAPTIPPTTAGRKVPPTRAPIRDRCDPARPNSPHPTDCYIFYQCVDRLKGTQQVEKTCNPPTMYNPDTMVCDWPEAVIKLRPECGWTESITRSPIKIPTRKPPPTPVPITGRCDPARPNSPHPTSCHLFYQCVDRLNGVEQVEKTCNPPTMYNPETMVCDWPETVMRIRSDCGSVATTTTKPPTDGPCVDGWTDWFSVSTPSEATGDFEVYENIVAKHSICPKSHISNIECKYLSRAGGSKKSGPAKPTLVDYTSSPDRNVQCSVSDGLICYNSDQESGLCQDYRVRFLCECEADVQIVTTPDPPTTEEDWCPEGYSWNTCAYSCNAVCLAYGSELKRRGYCRTTEGCAPGCTEDDENVGQQTSFRSKGCLPGHYWRDERTCVPARDCNCRTPYGKIIAPGSVEESDDGCEVCQCLDNEYVCDSSRCDYRWTTIAIDMSKNLSIVTRKPRPPGPTTSPTSCSAWSDWINEYNNPAWGDYESKTPEQLAKMGFCLNGKVVDIECRDVKNNRPWKETRDRDVVCSMQKGLACFPARQGKGGRCQDYKIRYFCECFGGDGSLVSTTPTPTTTKIMIWTKPPKPQRSGICPDNFLIPLLADHSIVPDSAFTATSSKSSAFGPSSARFSDSQSQKTNSKPVSWAAGKRDLDQHIQVDLGTSVWIDGFEISGHPTANEYVTSLFVLYSDDNERFSYVPNKKGKPRLFRGPLEHDAVKKNMFYAPIEARYIRLEPQTWKHAISLRFELLSCSIADNLITDPEPTPMVEVCNDQMGLENGLLDDSQVSLSSINGHFNEIRLGSDTAWVPTIHSRKEHVKLDFLEPRNLSGIVTQGHANGLSWVESYAVRYSSDDETWFTVLNDDGSQRVFHANVDGSTPHTNLFERLIHARYLKIVPWQWHEGIALRMDVLGCYLPVTITTTPPPTTTLPPATTPLPKFCHPCPNIPEEYLNVEHCACPLSQSWNGTGCVHPSQCPCFDGHTKYPIGSMFQAHDSCSQCICRLGGVSDCRKPTCPPCEVGLLSSLSEPPKCQCSCRPCETGSRLCQSSNVCLNDSLWCNGVEDCPDDELDCITTTQGPVECHLIVCAEGYTEQNTGLLSADGCPIYNCAPPRIRPTDTPCPDPSCPPGFILEFLQFEEYDEQQLGQLHQDYDQLSQQSNNYDTQQSHQSVDAQHSQQNSQNSQQTNNENCPPYKCVPEPTKPPPVTLPPFIDREDRCSMTGRMFRTFDGTDYSYDICHHVLMRDMLQDMWSVSVHKHCPNNKSKCTRSLRIHHNKDIIELLPSLRIAYKGFEYSILQAEQIASMSPDFSIHRVGDSVLFRSEVYGFWLVWDIHMNMKIGVTSKLIDHIDGLCGYYNQKPHDDQRTPTGDLASSTQDFGKSWSVDPSLEAECAPVHCPISAQTAAWDKCSFLRQEPFTRCHGSDESAVDQAVFRCVDVMCDCMGSTKDSSESPAAAAERCACQAMSVMAVECHDDHPKVDLSGWRSKYDCSVDCGTDGSIYKECNKQTCERSCQNNKNPHPCPPMPDLCYPGCVCPDGLVRHSDGKCVKPSECRDCVCESFGDPHYISFDRNNFTFSGNCSYIAARDKLSSLESKVDHDFQVLVTNKECLDGAQTICTEAVTVLFQDHVINIRHSEPTNSVIVTVDGVPVETFPVHLPWMRMEKLPGEQVSVLLMAIQVEVSYYTYSRGFKVRLPSQLYLNKTEGLCGNCNNEVDDDAFSNEIGLNWLVNKLLRESPNGEEEELCQVVPQPECKPLNPDSDPCLKLLDSDLFKMCNAVVDPLPYIAACQYDTCKTVDPVSASCSSFESYARECARYQVCLSWRSPQLCPVECPSGMEYRQCGSGCQSICDQDKDSLTCPMSVNDGCYCPVGQAFNQALGRCVHLDRCEPCDNEGHFRGDHWRPDPCTACSCDDDGHVHCVKRSCALEECPADHERTVIQPEKGECCPTVKCTKEENLITKKPCPDVPVPTCGQDQVLRFQDVDGCLHQVCDCIPFEDCPPMVPIAANIPGMKYVINTTGCCHHFERVCVVEDCPPHPDCPPFYESQVMPNSKGLCCPEHQCTPPNDVCIYEHTHQEENSQKTSPKGRPKKANVKVGKRSVQFRQDSLVQQYAINATWKDGPCLECTCIFELNNPIPRTACTATNCPEPFDEDYVIKTEPLANECCPRQVRTACRQGTSVHQVGEKWPAPNGDPCQTYICLETVDGLIVKQLQIESCTTTCPTGWEYQPGNSTVCCGACQQVACVTEDGVQHAIGQTWQSDLCTKSLCVSRDNGLQVESTRENCEEPSADDKLFYVLDKIQPKDRCCPVYRKTACLFENKEYKINDTWTTTDPCVTMVCAQQADGQVARQEIILSCPPPSACQEGYEHELPGPSECCGKCVQTACVLDGKLHPIGSLWNPNPCTFYSCVGSRGQAHIAEAQVMCSMRGDCPEKNWIVKPGECCATCNATQAQKNCQPEAMPLNKTIGYIVHSSVMHGKCTNTQPVDGLTECLGHCESGTVHEPDSVHPISRCDCCQPEETKELKTTLTCADGKTWAQVVRVPTSCTCSPCVGSIIDEQQSSHAEDFSQISQSPQSENLIQVGQKAVDEQQQSQQSLTEQVQQQLGQQDEDDTLSQILQQQRQGRGDAIARSSNK